MSRLTRRVAHVKVGELETDIAVVKNLEVLIGRVFDETWTEPVGPTPRARKEMRIPDPTLLSRLIRKRTK